MARGGQESSTRSGGTIWVTSETELHINKRPGSRDMAAASVMSVLLMATERNRWQRVQSPLLLLPLRQRWVGWKGGCVPAQGWGLGVLARLSGASCGGSGGSVESAFQRILLSAPPVRSPPLPSPPLSSPARDSLFNLPFALVSPVSGGSGGNGTGPTILQALLPMGPRIGLTDLAIKIQDAG